MSKSSKRIRYPKPAWELILEVLRKENRALTVREIVKLSGVKYNTVRGRLYYLKKRGLVENINGKWIAVK